MPNKAASYIRVSTSQQDTDNQLLVLTDWAKARKLEIAQIYEEWHNEGVLLLTINPRETFSVVTQYMQSKSLSFPVLFDTDGTVSMNYNIIGIPATFFIDKGGIIQVKRLGPFSSAAEIESYIPIIQS